MMSSFGRPMDGEQRVEKAVALQQEHPGVGPQQEVHPHGQHDEHHGHARRTAALLPGQKVGHGIAQQQTDDRGDDGQQEGAAEHAGVLRHGGEVLQREAAARRSPVKA